MNKQHATPLAALLAAAVLLLAAPVSLEAARAAVRLWLESFLPAMLPFFLLMPFLTGPDARACFSRAFGRLLPALFGIPGEAAGALLTGLAAGSPAGAIACAETAGGLSPAQFERCVYLCSGVSPAFLVTAVGAGCFHSARAGAVLLAAHLFALTCAGILLRSLPAPKRARPALAPQAPEREPILAAMLRLLAVLGWMIAFSVLSALLQTALGPIAPKWLVAGICEVASGAAATARAPLPEDLRVAATAAVCCFGGLCVAAQVASSTGVSPLRLLGVKLLHALLGGAAAWGLLRLDFPALPALPPDPFALSAVLAAGAAGVIALARIAGKSGVDEPPRPPYTDT